METPSSDPYLPPEILDYIVDFLQDDTDALKQCCLVSKSWVPRARKHIFAVVMFQEEDVLKLWKETFPDPASSPSYYTHILGVGCDPGDMEESDWIQGFPRVEQLIVDCEYWTDFLSFQKLGPSLKSILMTFSYLPHSQIFDLIRSLPFLEGLALIGEVIDTDESDGLPASVVSSSPALTETLYILVSEGISRTLCDLLVLPGGLRFRELELAWCHEPDLPHVTEMVDACSDTLKCLDIGYEIEGTLVPPFLV